MRELNGALIVAFGLGFPIACLGAAVYAWITLARDRRRRLRDNRLRSVGK